GAAAGAAGGALIESALTTVAAEVARRYTSAQEQERLGAVLLMAQEKIARQLNQGSPLREESFFAPRVRRHNRRLRSEAAELLEGSFLAAKDAFEERELDMIATFYGNLPFNGSIDTGLANHVLRLLDQLTYRQLVIIG